MRLHHIFELVSLHVGLRLDNEAHFLLGHVRPLPIVDSSRMQGQVNDKIRSKAMQNFNQKLVSLHVGHHLAD